MQPCSREMQAMNSILQQQGQQIQEYDTTSSHDEFLEQMLSSLPWPPNNSDLSAQNPNNSAKSPLPWDMCPPPPPTFDDQSVMLASKLRHHQISAAGGPGSPAAKALTLQQQLMLSRGLTGGGLSSPTDDSGTGDSVLLPLPLSLSSSDDTIDASSFKSLNPGGGDNSVQALYNGFAGSLHASHQTSNQTQNFHQGGTMQQAQNFGAPVGGMNHAPASGGAGGGAAAAQPRQRVRARRGQATDPHSIAERLRRERIAERMKSLQELVPNANKTDKASMLDEIIDYVKFLQLQVKVLSMSRLGGAGAAAAAPVAADISSEGGGDCSIQPNGTAAGGRLPNGAQTTASSSSNNDNMTVTEHQVAKLMEEDMGSAMQYLQGKGLCLMPISLATAISTATCHPSLSSARSHHNIIPPAPTSPVLSVQSATTTSVSKP